MSDPSQPRAAPDPTALRRGIARRVADAHATLAPGTLSSMLFGSTVDGICDERSDVDMSVVFEAFPAEAELAAACRRAGGGEWSWRNGSVDNDEGLAVGFDLEGIEVQIAYMTRRGLSADLDEVLVKHDPATLNHKVAEGVLKGEALLGSERVAQWQARVAQFPQELADAMLRHYIAERTPWRWFSLLLARDSGLWCRELQVDACYRLFGLLAGLNRRYFTVYQFKRMHRFAEQLALVPPRLADRIDALLAAPLADAFVALHGLEGEVLALVTEHAPHVDLTKVHEQRKRFDAAACAASAAADR
jgi:hypothetical protein